MSIPRILSFLLVLPLAVTGSAAAQPARDAELPSTRAVLVGARPWQPGPSTVTDPYAVYTIPQTPKGGYLVSRQDPTFGSLVMRIGNDVGAADSPLSGGWGWDARHTYSKQQPWNADGTLFVTENRNGGSPTIMFLDGSTLKPRLGPCSSSPLYDYRWHPQPAHAHEMINVDATGTELSWYDVTACTKTRRWTLPIKSDYGIGQGEGNPSADGRFVAVGNQSQMVVVDMDPQPPYAPWPNVRIGPVYIFPPCSLSTSTPTNCPIDNISVSPSGKYVVVKYGTTVDTTEDIARVYEVDPATLALAPHAMAATSMRCGSFQARPNGWIFGLKHSDLGMNPYDHDEDVLLGGRSCPGSTIGHVDMVRLRDGQLTALTDPNNEASVFHVSARNVNRPGWVYVSYFKTSGKRFSDEIVAIKMDGSQTVERWAHMHSASSGCYRCEPQPVPSRDGQRVIFASNWAQDCGTGCGSASDIKDYIVWSPDALDVDTGPGAGTTPAPVPVDLAIEGVRPNPAFQSPHIVYSLAGWGPARLELFDIGGRRVLFQDLGTPGPGRHETTLLGKAAPGLYWLRLSQEGRTASARVTLIG